MTVFKCTKGLPASFPMISTEVWVGGGHWYWSEFWFLLSFQAFNDIYFSFPVAISEYHVTLRYFLHMFSSGKTPFRPVAIRSSIINESFYLCGRGCAVVSSIDRFFSRMNCHVWAIQ